MSDSIEELATKLEGRATDLHDAAEGRRYGVTSDRFNAAAADLRAAALKLRECAEREKALREALEPFARQAQIFEDVGLVAFDDQFEPFDLTTNGHRIIGLTVGDLRRAAKALEAK